MPLESRQGLWIDELTESVDLEELAPVWHELWLNSSHATPFQSPAWLIPWWRHFGGRGLWTLVVRRAGELVGIAPLFIYPSANSGLRELLFVGTGISDYLDILARRGCERIVTSAMIDYLKQRRDRWDVCDFQELPFESAFLQGGVHSLAKIESQNVCPFLRLPGQVEEIPSVISPSMHEKLRYYRRRAAKLGTVSFRLADQTTFDFLFEALLRLHAARWRSRGLPGVLSSRVVQSFHRVVGPGFLSFDALRLYAMQVDDQIAGCLYAFSAKGRVWFYLSGFDPKYRDVCPGVLLIAHAIEQAVRERAFEFDFLRGEEPYKSSWGTQNRQTYRWREHANKLVGAIPNREGEWRSRGLADLRSA